MPAFKAYRTRAQRLAGYKSVDSEVRQFIEEARFHRASVERVAEMLPADDAEIDSWIADAVCENDLMAFMLLVMAALNRERPVNARHLAREPRLLPGAEYVACILLRMEGEVPECMLEGIRNTMMHSTSEAAALFVIAVWCEEHRGGVFPSQLIPAARALARRAKQQSDVVAFLLALALRTNDTGLNAGPEPHSTEARMAKTGPLDAARLDPLKIPRSLLESYFLRPAAFNLFDRAASRLKRSVTPRI